MYDLLQALHLGEIPGRRRHELSPVLFATAESGDRIARALVDRLAEEVVTMATVALTRLDLLAAQTPVLLGGSVLAARHRRLDDAVRALLAARAPRATAEVVTAPPVLGAALLGLDRLGATREAKERVRGYFGGGEGSGG
jgi:N-acetylglucosamine kinase-like BadF-type ATPase